MPGEVYAANTASDAEFASLQDQPFLTVRVQTGRDAATKLHKVDLPEEHVIEVTLEDGIVLYMRADRLLSNSEARGAEGGVLPMALSFDTRERGRGRGSTSTNSTETSSRRGTARIRLRRRSSS